MTLLEIIQIASTRLQLPSPSTVIGNTSDNTKLLLAMLNKAINDLSSDFAWPELQKEYLFTLVTSQEAYALPDDYDSRQNLTLWNRSQAWPLIGPVDAIAWQQYKSGLIVSLPRQRYRVKGWATNQFFIDPTPGTGENGQTCVFEYISNITKRPKFWVTSTAFGAGRYCSYNANIYRTTAGGTTGPNPPTHTSGTVSDGTVLWTYQSTYLNFIEDTDVPILNNDMLIDGTVWRFKAERGLDYQQDKQDSDLQVELAKTKLLGAEAITLNRALQAPWMISLLNYPEQNYGI